MLRGTIILQLWIAIPVIATAVAYGLVDRWASLEALIIGIPFLAWTYFTWRRWIEEREQEYTFFLIIRALIILFITSLFIASFTRDHLALRLVDSGSLAALGWLTPVFLFLVKRIFDLRRSLYQK
jgi:hypothetical protein